MKIDFVQCKVGAIGTSKKVITASSNNRYVSHVGTSFVYTVSIVLFILCRNNQKPTLYRSVMPKQHRTLRSARPRTAPTLLVKSSFGNTIVAPRRL